MQRHAEELPVRALDIQNAAQRLANHLRLQDFKCSVGWLWQLRRSHGVGNLTITDELLSPDTSAVDLYCKIVCVDGEGRTTRVPGV